MWLLLFRGQLLFFSCSYRFFVVSFYINTMVFYKTQLNLSELISYFKFGVKFGAKFPQVQRGTWELSSELEVPRKFISSARDLSELVVTSNHFNLFQVTSSLPLSTCKFTSTREHSSTRRATAPSRALRAGRHPARCPRLRPMQQGSRCSRPWHSSPSPTYVPAAP